MYGRGAGPRRQAPLLAGGPRAKAPDSAEASNHLVVCLDGGSDAEQALPLAAAWARRLGWRVSVVTAADSAHIPRHCGGNPHICLQEIARARIFEGLRVDTHALWGTAYPHVALDQHIHRHPADLVVATTNARTSFARAALGSEVGRIIHSSRVPVLVERMAGLDPGT